MATKKTVTAPASLVLDSSCWLEVFDGHARGAAFEAQVAQVKTLIVPVMTVYEVYKYLRRTKGEELAAQAVTYMQQGQVIELDLSTALDAASNGLPIADSIIYATAQLHHATLWTQDAHFEGLPGVKYFPK
jgi:toxin FitB